MFGVDLSDPSNSPIVVFIGLLVGQLFLYGRKVKANVKIATRELIGDLMQFGAQFAGAMGLLAIARGMGWDLNSVWQVVTITILFTMTFDQWFTRLRLAFTDRMGAAADALLGKTPTDGVMRVPSGEGVPAALDVTFINEKVSTAELLAELSRRGVPLMEVIAKIQSDTPKGPLNPDPQTLQTIHDRTGLPVVDGDEDHLLRKLDELPGATD